MIKKSIMSERESEKSEEKGIMRERCDNRNNGTFTQITT